MSRRAASACSSRLHVRRARARAGPSLRLPHHPRPLARPPCRTSARAASRSRRFARCAPTGRPSARITSCKTARVESRSARIPESSLRCRLHRPRPRARVPRAECAPRAKGAARPSRQDRTNAARTANAFRLAISSARKPARPWMPARRVTRTQAESLAARRASRVRPIRAVEADRRAAAASCRAPAAPTASSSAPRTARARASRSAQRNRDLETAEALRTQRPDSFPLSASSAPLRFEISYLKRQTGAVVGGVHAVVGHRVESLEPEAGIAP